MKKALSTAILLFVLGLFVSNANAELITISLSATVNYARDDGGYLEGKIDVGSIITGSYTYESTTPDSKPETWGGDYWHYSSPAGVFLSVGGFEFKTDLENVAFCVSVRDNTPDDVYAIGSSNNSLLSNGVSVESIWWQLNDHTHTAFSSDALPVTEPVLRQWQANVLDIEGEQGGYHLMAEVTSVEIIPEPVTFLLFVTGFTGIRLINNRKSRQL
jgi:hypothetical protein